MTDLMLRRKASMVSMVEEIDLALRIFRRGGRVAGHPCRLIIALNGNETVYLKEHCGPAGPDVAIVDIRSQSPEAVEIIEAMRYRPWDGHHLPVLAYGRSPGEIPALGVRYLVLSDTVLQVIEAIREVLDLAPGQRPEPMPPGHSFLDVAEAGG